MQQTINILINFSVTYYFIHYSILFTSEIFVVNKKKQYCAVMISLTSDIGLRCQTKVFAVIGLSAAYITKDINWYLNKSQV